VGNGVPQVVATVLALGELTSFWRLGSFTYWQRQGLCSFNLLQHKDVGLLADVIALAHALSSSGLHVIALHTRAPSSTTSTTQNATYAALFIIFACSISAYKLQPKRERQKWRWVQLVAAVSSEFIAEWGVTLNIKIIYSDREFFHGCRFKKIKKVTCRCK